MALNSKICRFCMKEVESKYSHSFETKLNLRFRNILTLFGIYISPDDCACEDCMTFVGKIHNFFEMVQKTNETLQSTDNIGSSSPIFKIDNEFKINITNDRNVCCYASGTNNEAFNNTENKLNIKDSLSDSDEKFVDCTSNLSINSKEKDSGTAEDDKNGVMLFLPGGEKVILSEKDTLNFSGNPSNCSLCYERFDNIIDYHIHRSNHNKILQYQKSNKEFTNEKPVALQENTYKIDQKVLPSFLNNQTENHKSEKWYEQRHRSQTDILNHMLSEYANSKRSVFDKSREFSNYNLKYRKLIDSKHGDGFSANFKYGRRIRSSQKRTEFKSKKFKSKLGLKQQTRRRCISRKHKSSKKFMRKSIKSHTIIRNHKSKRMVCCFKRKLVLQKINKYKRTFSQNK